jgi:hypothetical protein
MASISAMSSAMTVIAGNAQRSGGGKVYHLQYLPLPQGIWRRSVFFLHVVAADQAQWCTPVARTSRPVMRCAIADCGRQIMVSSATASAIAALHMRSSLMVLKSPGRGAGSCGPCCRDRHAFRTSGRTLLVASAPSGDLFIYAKDLFVAASRAARPKNDGGRAHP